MKFFIDTANLKEIETAASMGVLDGVTTNPSLAAKESAPYKELLADICKIVPGPVSAEVLATDADGMLKEAEELVKIADNIVIKIPTILEGLKAIKSLTERGIKTNATLVFSSMQALLVAKAGATYVSPFVGRLDDISSDGMQLIADIVTIYQNYVYETEVLVASVRHPMHVVEAARMGADVVTMPAEGYRAAHQASVDRHRSGEVHCRLQKGREGRMIERYTLPEMKELWSEEAKFQSWLEVEIEAAKAMAKHKIIPAKAARAIAAKGKFDVARINEIEAEVNHDVIAFLTSVSEHVGEESKYLHFGMTSSDMLDTAQALRIRQAARIIDKKIQTTLKLVRSLAHKHKTTPCLGRTHGMAAEPTTVGLKLSVWYAELIRRRETFLKAARQLEVGAISGAVGNYANLEPKIEAAVCRAPAVETGPGLDAGDPEGSSRRVLSLDGPPGIIAREVRYGNPQPAANRDRGDAGRVHQGPEGVVSDAPQEESDHRRARDRDCTAASRVRADSDGERAAVA